MNIAHKPCLIVEPRFFTNISDETTGSKKKDQFKEKGTSFENVLIHRPKQSFIIPIIKCVIFVLRLFHLKCRSRRFDCSLLVFFRRWNRLITRHHLYHEGRLWLVHFDSPIVSLFRGVEFPHRSVVVQFSCCGVFDREHPCVRNFNSTIPVDVIRVKSYVDSFLDPASVCTSEDLDQ